MQPNYLQLFTEALKTKDPAKRKAIINEMNPTSDVAKSIDQTAQAMFNANQTFIIEPDPSTISTQPKGDIIHYQGDFIYGFETNGVFHEIPGDPTTIIPREVNQTSQEIKFSIDPQTQKLTSIYESMAGNTFGKKPKSNTLTILFTLIIIALALIIFAITN